MPTGASTRAQERPLGCETKPGPRSLRRASAWCAGQPGTPRAWAEEALKPCRTAGRVWGHQGLLPHPHLSAHHGRLLKGESHLSPQAECFTCRAAAPLRVARARPGRIHGSAPGGRGLLMCCGWGGGRRPVQGALLLRGSDPARRRPSSGRSSAQIASGPDRTKGLGGGACLGAAVTTCPPAGCADVTGQAGRVWLREHAQVPISSLSLPTWTRGPWGTLGDVAGLG